MENHNGPWFLNDLAKVEENGFKVFSCFSCGGGSTMGYKLAGYDVIGCNEIDPKMMKLYRQNLKPSISYLMPIQEFKELPDSKLDPRLFKLDILDGSPPCSSFSTAGQREKTWGKSKKFREGQAKQVLDDLFFHFIDVAKKLQPRIVLAENVTGLVKGRSRGYVKMIFQRFKEAGYYTQLFQFNAARMGVPQRRERIFFVANRLGKKFGFEFNEKPIPLREAFRGIEDKKEYLTERQEKLWEKCKPGESFSKYDPRGKKYGFAYSKLQPDMPGLTLVTKSDSFLHWK